MLPYFGHVAIRVVNEDYLLTTLNGYRIDILFTFLQYLTLSKTGQK